MWHEARKQEKKIRCMLVDYQRRAQRRKDYYDKIKADPTQFLQLHGRSCKIHLDPAVCIAANSSATMMPWQGNTTILIDRFDVRAHLDYIPEVKNKESEDGELSYDERQINYERYRILVQNDFFSITEDKFLHQIHLEEKFGSVLKNSEEPNPTKKKACAAIGYNYDEDDSTNNTSLIKIDEPAKNNFSSPSGNGNAEDENDSESDIDLDLTVDVSKIETPQANELNSCAHAYGMITNDFFSFLNNDLEEAENMRIAREQEEEKAMFSGRKSRKERRAFRERTLVGRKLSPPSYASRKSPLYEDYKALVSTNRSRSKSVSPVNSGKITYITSFGEEEPAASSSLASSASKNAARQKISRSRSRSREHDCSKRRRSRSASADYRKRLSSRRHSPSISKSKMKIKRSRSRSETRKESSPRASPRNVPEISLASGSGLNNNSEPLTVPRYYGRNVEKSSSELSLSSDDESANQNQTAKSKTNQVASLTRHSSSNKSSVSDNKLTPQERLRRKRQVLLNKQFKADKRAEREKVLKQVQERIDRAEEMKEISIKLRRRQRLLRHGDDSPGQYSSRSRSSSVSGRSASPTPYSRRHRHEKHRKASCSDSSSDSKSSKNNRRRGTRKYRNSLSRSRSSTHSSSSDSRSRSRNRSRSPRKRRYSEERDSKRTSKKDYDKASRTRRYRTPSEERKVTQGQLDRAGTGRRDDYKNDYRPRRERSPRSTNECDERRDRTRDGDRYGASRSKYSGHSLSSRDRYSRY